MKYFRGTEEGDLLRSRSPGCLRKSHGSFRFRAQRKADPLEQNLGALNVELTPGNLSAIEEASSHIKLEGAPYPAFHAKLVGR